MIIPDNRQRQPFLGPTLVLLVGLLPAAAGSVLYMFCHNSSHSGVSLFGNLALGAGAAVSVFFILPALVTMLLRAIWIMRRHHG